VKLLNSSIKRELVIIKNLNKRYHCFVRYLNNFFLFPRWFYTNSNLQVKKKIKLNIPNRLLSTSKKIEWSKLFLFLVDERFVPSTDKDSNTKLVNDTLVNLTKIPKENFIFPDTSLSLKECVSDYATKLKNLFNKVGVCDIMTLGMGNFDIFNQMERK
jgi:hypothetical protein